MNRKFSTLLFLLPLLGGCRSTEQSPNIVSMQMVDRNGFSETISNNDRLKIYEKVDFLSSQPYEKVLRVYKKDAEGKSHSKLTNYHTNGGIWQYLEAIDGRAHGRFLEWHPNGKIRIEANVIEGKADLNEIAQQSWLFDKECSVWDEAGDLLASFTYDKGKLIGEAKYYFSNGSIEKTVSYVDGVAEGPLFRYAETGERLEEIHYKNGQKEGNATSWWSPEQPKYQEFYENNQLITATYSDQQGTLISEISAGEGLRAVFHEDRLHSLIEYHNGMIDGEVKLFSPNGTLRGSYQVHEGKKTGEEWEYYPSSKDKSHPKLMLTWFEDQIQGMAKTWYKNGKLESQREMTNNKKHGLSFAYYESGDLMLMEEYENDRLLSGSYYKKGEKNPTSSIEKGDGIATIYNSQGHFIKKVSYERGKPVID